MFGLQTRQAAEDQVKVIETLHLQYMGLIFKNSHCGVHTLYFLNGSL